MEGRDPVRQAEIERELLTRKQTAYDTEKGRLLAGEYILNKSAYIQNLTKLEKKYSELKTKQENPDKMIRKADSKKLDELDRLIPLIKSERTNVNDDNLLRKTKKASTKSGVAASKDTRKAQRSAGTGAGVSAPISREIDVPLTNIMQEMLETENAVAVVKNIEQGLALQPNQQRIPMDSNHREQLERMKAKYLPKSDRYRIIQAVIDGIHTAKNRNSII